MRKYFLVVAFLMGLATMAVAGPVQMALPESSNGSVYPPEYGGFEISTSNFSVDGGTFTGTSVIPWVNFSTGTVDDYVDIFITSGTVNGSTLTVGPNTHASRVARIFNVGNSTGTGPAAFARGLSPAGNLKVVGRSSWMWKPSNSSTPGITLYYTGGKQWDNGGN